MTGTVATHSAPAAAYHAVTAVWGAEFIDLFLNVCVPNQLSSGNLSALPAGSRYRVLTGSADIATLAASPVLGRVRRLLPVDVVEVDLTELDRQANPNVYKMMTACHRRAAADAARVEAALIFLAPDFVLAEGTLAALVRRHASGARAILTANLRLSRERFLAERTADRATPRALVRLGLRHLHPSSESLMVDAATTNEFPTSVYWPVRSSCALDGVLVRALNLHPLLLDPVLRTSLPGGTIDGHYVTQCCPDPDQCVVIDDSDELIAFELTPSARAVGNHDGRRGISMLRLAAVTAKCDALQLSHWNRSIRLHAEDLDERWTMAEADAALFTRRLERYRFLAPALSRMYRTLKTWRRRRAAQARAIRRARKDSARLLRKAVRHVRQSRDRYGRALRDMQRNRLSSKRIARSARVSWHHAARAARLGLKRIRRRVRQLLPA